MQLRFSSLKRGKSGLQRASRQVTPGRRNATESATENKPPALLGAGKGEKVRQELTAHHSNVCGTANPGWSKAK
jgi:hypothetical protein